MIILFTLFAVCSLVMTLKLEFERQELVFFLGKGASIF
jgi:hypothetical protein